jgi:two-component system NarL family response regulator
MRKLMNMVAAQPAPPQQLAPDLTEREFEVLGLVAQGLSNREIASQLVISEKTVKTHISSLLSKLGQEDRTRQAIFAIKRGLVPLG